MGWVADARGLGGARALDGLAWDLEVADVWEAWVRGFANALAPQLGLRQPGLVETRRPLRWEGGVASMGSLAPDVGLIGDHRVVWIDAKYKAHLSLLARHGWRGTTELVRDAHRADLHQALAYAALVDVDRVDTVLLYPHLDKAMLRRRLPSPRLLRAADAYDSSSARSRLGSERRSKRTRP